MSHYVFIQRSFDTRVFLSNNSYTKVKRNLEVVRDLGDFIINHNNRVWQQSGFNNERYFVPFNNNQTRIVNKLLTPALITKRWESVCQETTGTPAEVAIAHREVSQLEPAKQLFATQQIAQFERRLAKPASITDFNYTNKQSLWRVDESLESLTLSQSTDSVLLS